ncbi:hypothetical protein [Aeromicrobium piscarium]|uniref:CPBP family intramembrane metalloprotease n=1 Tax=Aeromicrobium piscarium TaxID=2590901 RepID=A0A554RWG6_9ACTN|nr:hypothetical protein [Aeromicrobium piscarium]TSD58430.1 hypothetical protein FNM00_14625 [Aeromicrobium piscarium]
MDRLGARWGAPSGYGLALLLLLPLVLAGWLAIVLVPAEVIEEPGVSVAYLTSMGAAAAIVLRAAGEEIFFRGLIVG